MIKKNGFKIQSINENDLNALNLHAEQITCARDSINKGVSLAEHMAVQDKFERLDSVTYTIICKMFVNANPDNVKFVNPNRYKLNAAQVKKICIAAGKRNEMQKLFPDFVADKCVKVK